MSNNGAKKVEVGKLHEKVTKVYNTYLDQTIEKLEEGEDAEFCVDFKAVDAAGKWALNNGAYAIEEEDTTKSPLQRELEEIRNRHSKVISFAKEA